MSKKRAPIEPLSASSHDEAPRPLVGEDAGKRSTIGLEYMSYEELEQFGEELDALRQRTLDSLGQADADYIRRVIKVQRAFEVLGRIGILTPFFWPTFVAGIVLLGRA